MSSQKATIPKTINIKIQARKDLLINGTSPAFNNIHE
jgi:hypothetical protein